MKKNVSKSVSDAVTSNVGSYPPKNRYQDCVGEEEGEDLDLEGSDLVNRYQDCV